MPALWKLMNHVELTDGEYQKYCELIYRVAGIRIAENKRVMVSNRVRRRLRATGISSFAEYLHLPDLARRKRRDASVSRCNHHERDLFLSRHPELRLAGRYVSS